MFENWTFGRKVAAGFALSFVFLLVIGTASYVSITRVLNDSEWVTHTHVVLETTANIFKALRNAQSGLRGYIITGDDEFLAPYRAGMAAIDGLVKQLRSLTADNLSQQKRLDQLEPIIAMQSEGLKRSVAIRQQGDASEAGKLVRAADDKKNMDEIWRILDDMESEEHRLLALRASAESAAAAGAKSTIIIGTSLCVLSIILVGGMITGSLSRQIGSSVGKIQSSSTNLQAAANQQATATKEQATAMAEITTTISELMATSRQIAESSQRVAQIATQTANAARSGAATVATADEAITRIRQQVDLIVHHMLELGKKSQQIGAVLEIVAELAEQTNILAVNATIEAAGANEAGRRFAVVADEIRKLADRVATSTKEIRGLIDDVRSSVNATIMTTESGSKAVDVGASQFAAFSGAFNEIAALVTTTTEASREIELSTKQQATAVEQVNVAITSAAQATKENETSSGQTLRTAIELNGFSRALLRIAFAKTRVAAIVSEGAG